MNEFNKKIQKIKEDMQEKNRLNRLLNNSLSQKDEIFLKVKNLKEQLKKEVKDVDKLKGMSVQNFIHSIVGNKVEKLKKEQEEMISAKFKYESAINELKYVKDTIQTLKEKINSYGNLDEKYEDLLKEKEQFIYSNNSYNSNELVKIAEEMGRIRGDIKELEEALYAGNEVVKSLIEVEASLQSASNWGTLDMFGGGFVSTMMKHSEMNTAQSKIQTLQTKLTTYNRELKDIGTSFDTNVSIDSFLTFADYFFDGFFVDWAVQSKISEAKNSVLVFKNKVENLNYNIKEKIDTLSEKLNDLEDKRIRIVESL